MKLPDLSPGRLRLPPLHNVMRDAAGVLAVVVLVVAALLVIVIVTVLVRVVVGWLRVRSRRTFELVPARPGPQHDDDVVRPEEFLARIAADLPNPILIARPARAVRIAVAAGPDGIPHHRLTVPACAVGALLRAVPPNMALRPVGADDRAGVSAGGPAGNVAGRTAARAELSLSGPPGARLASTEQLGGPLPELHALLRGLRRDLAETVEVYVDLLASEPGGDQGAFGGGYRRLRGGRATRTAVESGPGGWWRPQVLVRARSLQPDRAQQLLEASTLTFAWLAGDNHFTECGVATPRGRLLFTADNLLFRRSFDSRADRGRFRPRRRRQRSTVTAAEIAPLVLPPRPDSSGWRSYRQAGGTAQPASPAETTLPGAVPVGVGVGVGVGVTMGPDVHAGDQRPEPSGPGTVTIRLTPPAAPARPSRPADRPAPPLRPGTPTPPVGSNLDTATPQPGSTLASSPPPTQTAPPTASIPPAPAPAPTAPPATPAGPPPAGRPAAVRPEPGWRGLSRRRRSRHRGPDARPGSDDRRPEGETARLPTYRGDAAPGLLPLGQVRDGEGWRPVALPVDGTTAVLHVGGPAAARESRIRTQFMHAVLTGSGGLFLDPSGGSLERMRPYLGAAADRVVEIDLTSQDRTSRQPGWNVLSMTGRPDEDVDTRVGAVADPFCAALGEPPTGSRTATLVRMAVRTLCELNLRLPGHLQATVFQLDTVLADEEWRAAISPALPAQTAAFWHTRYGALGDEPVEGVSDLLERLRGCRGGAALLGSPRSTVEVGDLLRRGRVVLVRTGTPYDVPPLAAALLLHDVIAQATGQGPAEPAQSPGFWLALDDLLWLDPAGTLGRALPGAVHTGLRVLAGVPSLAALGDPVRDPWLAVGSVVAGRCDPESAEVLVRNWNARVGPRVLGRLDDRSAVAGVRLGAWVSAPFVLRAPDEADTVGRHYDPLAPLALRAAAAADRSSRPVTDTLDSLVSLSERIADHVAGPTPPPAEPTPLPQNVHPFRRRD